MSKQVKLIVRLIPLESFELIRIYLKKCDYTIYMDMNKKDLKRLSKLQLIKLLLKQEAKSQAIALMSMKK